MKRERAMRKVVFGRIGLLMLVLGSGFGIQAKNVFDWRMVFSPRLHFSSQELTEEAISFHKRMNAAGYNCMLLEAEQIRKLQDPDPNQIENLRKMRASADQYGITIVPMGQGQGGNSFIDPIYAESFINLGTRFLVGNGVALPKGDSSVSFANGGFESGLTDWQATRPYLKIDNTVARSGRSSLRCDDPTANYVMATQWVTVKPHRTYELSMWVKTQNIKTYNNKHGDDKCRDIAFTVLGGNVPLLNDRSFRNGLGVNTNWKQVKGYFNSLDKNRVKVSVQATQKYHYTGTAWFDDVSITDVGLHDALIRQGLPVTVKTTTGVQLKEGVDYTVGDGKLMIPAGSAARPGDELLVDWHRSAGDVAYCYKEVWDGVREEIRIQDSWFGTPPARHMKYSEWRLAGWDPVCMQKHAISEVGSGRYMASVANNTAALYREANGSRESIIWNDAFDPYHNAVTSYWLVNGGAMGSGYEMSEDIIILNWNVHNRRGSLKFFAGTEGKNRPGWGIKTTRQRQIIAPGRWNGWNGWLPLLDSLENEGSLPDGSVIGIAYNSWSGFPESYDKIETMAVACESAGRWGNGPVPFPKATPGIPFDFAGIKGQSKCREANPLSLSVISSSGSGMKSLRFSLPEARQVQLTLFNMQGQTVAKILTKKVAAGVHARKIDMSKMGPGVYFVKLELAGRNVQTLTRKLVVL